MVNGVSAPSAWLSPMAMAVLPVPGAPASSTPRPASLPSRTIAATGEKRGGGGRWVAGTRTNETRPLLSGQQPRSALGPARNRCAASGTTARLRRTCDDARGAVARVDDVARRNVLNSVQWVYRESHTLQQMANEHRIAIVGALYHLDTGAIEFFVDHALGAPLGPQSS